MRFWKTALAFDKWLLLRKQALKKERKQASVLRWVACAVTWGHGDVHDLYCQRGPCLGLRSYDIWGPCSYLCLCYHWRSRGSPWSGLVLEASLISVGLLLMGPLWCGWLSLPPEAVFMSLDWGPYWCPWPMLPRRTRKWMWSGCRMWNLQIINKKMLGKRKHASFDRLKWLLTEPQTHHNRYLQAMKSWEKTDCRWLWFYRRTHWKEFHEKHNNFFFFLISKEPNWWPHLCSLKAFGFCTNCH